MIESHDCGPNGMRRDSTAHAYFSLVVTQIDAKQKKKETAATNNKQRHRQHNKPIHNKWKQQQQQQQQSNQDMYLIRKAN